MSSSYNLLSEYSLAIHDSMFPSLRIISRAYDNISTVCNPEQLFYNRHLHAFEKNKT